MQNELSKTSWMLIHGALGCANDWKALQNALEPTHSLQVSELPGHGKRSGERIEFHIEDFAKDVSAQLASAPQSVSHLFGYSMGGYVALYAAARGWLPGVRQIVTPGTKYAWTEATAAQEAAMLNPDRMQKDFPDWVAKLQVNHGHHWRSVVQKTAEMMQNLGKNPLLNSTLLQSVPCRVLVLRGRKDRMVTEEESQSLSADLPHGRYQMLNNVPHPLDRIETNILAKVLEECSGPG